MSRALVEEFRKFNDRLDNVALIQAKLIKDVGTVWANQKELAKSEHLLDEQFAVSTRMFIVTMNGLCEKLGYEERIDAEDIKQLFLDWATFQKRSDYRELMMQWFLGVALDKLPPPPAKKEEVKDGQGADGNANAGEGKPQDGGAVPPADVPQVQAKDGAPAAS